MKRSSKKGFTLAELLIVIAILAILIAIMFPVFGAQLDKARAAAELANVRAAYSELVADAMLGTGDDLTIAEGNAITVKGSDLAKALSYDKTTIKLEGGATLDATNNTLTPDADGGTITVTYNNKYKGSFTTDGDVILDTTGGTSGEFTKPADAG